MDGKGDQSLELESPCSRQSRKRLWSMVNHGLSPTLCLLLTSAQGTLLQQAQQLVSMNKPPKRDYDSVRNFVESKRPLLEEDAGFIDEKEDLITLRPGRETSFVDAFVERMLKTCNCKPIQVLAPVPITVIRN